MSFIKRLFSSKAPRRLEHLVFGEAIYIEAELGSYWEAEVAFEDGRLFVAIESQDQQEPTIHQSRFTDGS